MSKPRHSKLRENLRTSKTVGGGAKKILYTLNTVRRIGLKQSASNFGGALKRKRLSEEDFQRKQRSIIPQLDYRGFMRVAGGRSALHPGYNCRGTRLRTA